MRWPSPGTAELKNEEKESIRNGRISILREIPKIVAKLIKLSRTTRYGVGVFELVHNFAFERGVQEWCAWVTIDLQPS